jgi:hypothetical protein
MDSSVRSPVPYLVSWRKVLLPPILPPRAIAARVLAPFALGPAPRRARIGTVIEQVRARPVQSLRLLFLVGFVVHAVSVAVRVARIATAAEGSPGTSSTIALRLTA